MDKRKITYFEIFLVVSLSISFSWIIGDIYGTTPKIENILEFISLIPSVSAQATECCVNTNYGASCVDLPTGDCDSSCNEECVPTSCQSVSQCVLGCGFDKSEGTCNPNIPKVACDENENCEFLNDPFCNVPQCQQGCCVVGLNSYWGTQSECEIQGERAGISSEFDSSVESEQACFRESQNLEEGACVFNLGDEKNSCVFTNQLNCDNNINGVFYKGYLCSNTELDTNCEKQDSTNCFEGKDEIYWYDSCGNRENIYSSDKTRSWNNGKVLAKGESCNPNSDNSGSGSCGNCNYELGSICGEFNPGVDKGNMEGFTCKDLNCIDSEKKSRINGESWCVYDGPIGSGSLLSGKSGGLLSGILGNFEGSLGFLSTDLVGSRHFRQVCSNGEVQVEPCADYRKEICVQNEKKLDNGKKVDDAICRVNLWEQCLSYNGGLGEEGCGAGCLAKCGNNPDCRIQPIFVDSDFKFNTCVPKYPPGFDLGKTSGMGGILQSFAGVGDFGNFGDLGGQLGNLGGEQQESDASQICGLASQTCQVTYQKMCPGGWKAVKNEKCESASFTAQMNNLCVSLGDCGVYTNIEGKTGFGGAKVSKKGNHGKTPPQPFILFPVYAILSKTLKPVPPSGGFFQEENNLLNLPTGIIDPFLNGYNRVNSGGVGPGGLLDSVRGNAGAIGISGVAGAGIGGAVGVATYSVSSAALGSLTVEGITTSYTLTSTTGVSILGSGVLSPLALTGIGLGVGIVVGIVLTQVLGCGQQEIVEIKFECKQWQPPPGGRDCEKCSDDPLKPCSKYRCESLGNRCSLLNEGTGVQECISIEGENTIPIITPLEEVLNKSLYKYEEISNNGFRVRTSEGECLPAFSPIVFGVKTDVYADCRWSLEPFRYENSSQSSPFLEGLTKQVFTKNHTMVTFLPSAESLLAGEVNNQDELNQILDEEIEGGLSVRQYLLNQVGDLNVYVQCANLDGNANDQNYRINFCVDPSPDEQPPVIIATAPPENNLTKFDATEQQVAMFISEPAECKWDTIKPIETDKTNLYNSLTNEMSCEVDPSKGGLLGWPCISTFAITDLENKFYVQCKDQPWLGNNESRNIGSVYEYKLYRSESELVINSVKPAGEIFAGAEPVIVDLEVKTSGGAENGNAICEWGFDPEFYIDKFTDSNGKEHHYSLNQMIAGDYEVYIRCRDIAGNIAEESSSFNLKLDTKPPIVTRVFNEGGRLILTMDEPSRCFYNVENSCSFSNENLTEFEGGNSQTLTTNLDKEINYNIICQDVWGNRPDACSIIIKEFKDG